MLSLVVSKIAFSQDVIFQSNGEVILANNIIIKADSVTYTDFNDSSKTAITISKSNVKRISFENGFEVKIIKNSTSPSKSDLPPNIISFHLFDLIISNFTLSFERILYGGKLGIQVPISIGYNDETTSLPLPFPIDSDYTNRMVTKFYSGININFYPTGQGKFKYFLGPAIHVGNGKYFQHDDGYSSYYNLPIETNFAKLLLTNGIVFSPVEAFSISAVATIGIQHMFVTSLKMTETTGGLSINLSLRF